MAGALGVVLLLAGCGSSVEVPPTAPIAPIAERDPAPPAGPSRCEAVARELPSSVIAERVHPQCPPRTAQSRVVCLESLDGVGRRDLVRVDATGTVAVIDGTADARVEASDARALTDGGFRYVRTIRGDGDLREIVLVAPDGSTSTTPGGAPRAVLLGGPAFVDSTSTDGRLFATSTTHTLSPPAASIVLFDMTTATCSPHGEADRCVALSHFEIDGADEVPARDIFIAEDGARFGALVERRGQALLYASERAGPPSTRALGDGSHHYPLRATNASATRFVAGAHVVDAAGARAAGVEPMLAAAFDPCDRWIWIAGGDPIGLYRVAGGQAERVAEAPDWVERIEASPDGAFLVLSRFVSIDAGPMIAWIVSTSDGSHREIALPERTERVSYDPVGAR
jgi:hypothetical protein